MDNNWVTLMTISIDKYVIAITKPNLTRIYKKFVELFIMFILIYGIN